MQAHSGFLLRNCYPNCLVPQLLLNFLLLPCLSFLCSVFNVQSSMQASYRSLRRKRQSSLTSLHLLFLANFRSLGQGRGCFSVSSNFKPTKCLKFEGDKLPGPTKKLRFAGLRVLRAIRSGPFGGLKWTRTTDLTIISRVL